MCLCAGMIEGSIESPEWRNHSKRLSKSVLPSIRSQPQNFDRIDGAGHYSLAKLELNPKCRVPAL